MKIHIRNFKVVNMPTFWYQYSSDRRSLKVNILPHLFLFPEEEKAHTSKYPTEYLFSTYLNHELPLSIRV